MAEKRHVVRTSSLWVVSLQADWETDAHEITDLPKSHQFLTPLRLINEDGGLLLQNGMVECSVSERPKLRKNRLYGNRTSNEL